MGPISLSIPVDAPRERIFDFLSDLSVREGWTENFASDFRLERIPAQGRGAAARFRVDAPGGIAYMETVIAETERPFRIVEHGRGGRLDRVKVRLVWELAEGPTTTVSLTFWTLPPTFLGRIREWGRSGWWARRWRRALRRMRDLVESGADVPRTEVAGADRLPSAVV